MRTHWDPGMNMAAKAEAAAQKNLSSSRKALMEAAQQFEALFLNLLLAEMRKTVPENDLFGNQRAEKLFQSMLDQEIADHSVKTQSLGLAKMIYDQMAYYIPEED
jgi:flagellar protein FlgJ